MYPHSSCAEARFELRQDVWTIGVYDGCGFTCRKWIAQIDVKGNRKDYVLKGAADIEFRDGYFFATKEQAMQALKS